MLRKPPSRWLLTVKMSSLIPDEETEVPVLLALLKSNPKAVRTDLFFAYNLAATNLSLRFSILLKMEMSSPLQQFITKGIR